MADLSGADLSVAILSVANLSVANLSGVDLSEATFIETILANVDLSSCKGLDSCTHHGPSIIDHRTLRRPDRCPWSSCAASACPTT